MFGWMRSNTYYGGSLNWNSIVELNSPRMFLILITSHWNMYAEFDAYDQEDTEEVAYSEDHGIINPRHVDAYC